MMTNDKEKVVRPWKMLAADMFHWDGREYVLVVDLYSRFFDLGHDTKAVRVVHVIKSILARHGVPDYFISDNGPYVRAREFQQFAKEWGFVVTSSSPRYAQANGMAEKYVGIVKRSWTLTLNLREDPVSQGLRV